MFYYALQVKQNEVFLYVPVLLHVFKQTLLTQKEIHSEYMIVPLKNAIRIPHRLLAYTQSEATEKKEPNTGVKLFQNNQNAWSINNVEHNYNIILRETWRNKK